jgi:hypothetical protein
VNLTEKQKSEVTRLVNGVFQSLKARLMGRFYTGPKIFFQVVEDTNPIDTIEGLYTFTAHMLYGPGVQPTKKRVKNLAKITGNYIESQKLKTINHILMAAEESETLDNLDELLTDEMDKATKYIKKVVATDLRNVQANAEREGIEKLGASIGVEDPEVAKLGVIDDKLCKTCKKLWHDDSNIKKPKVYKMSMLKEGYMKSHKNPEPTISASHPHCRHVLTMIPPGYGFNERGNLEFMGFNYSAYDAQGDI